MSPDNLRFPELRRSGRRVEDDPASAIHPSPEVPPQDAVVTKRRLGAFAAAT